MLVITADQHCTTNDKTILTILLRIIIMKFNGISASTGSIIGLFFVTSSLSENIISPLMGKIPMFYRVIIILLIALHVLSPYIINKVTNLYSKKYPEANFDLICIYEWMPAVVIILMIAFLFIILSQNGTELSDKIIVTIFNTIVSVSILFIIFAVLFSYTIYFVIRSEKILILHRNIIDEVNNNLQINTDIANETLLFFKKNKNAEITATSAVFKKVENQKIQFLLVYNHRYNWWLPPGTHCRDWQSSIEESPYNKAYEAIKREGLVKGQIIQTFTAPSARCYDSLVFLKPPPYLLWLEVPENGNVAKCHSYHLDFFYVFEYIEDINQEEHEKAYKRIWVTINMEDSEEQIKSNIKEEIARENGSSHLQSVIVNFPEDLAQRIWFALEFYKTNRQVISRQ